MIIYKCDYYYKSDDHGTISIKNVTCQDSGRIWLFADNIFQERVFFDNIMEYREFTAYREIPEHNEIFEFITFTDIVFKIFPYM